MLLNLDTMAGTSLALVSDPGVTNVQKARIAMYIVATKASTPFLVTPLNEDHNRSYLTE